jgi:hypothetical protein
MDTVEHGKIEEEKREQRARAGGDVEKQNGHGSMSLDVTGRFPVVYHNGTLTMP